MRSGWPILAVCILAGCADPAALETPPAEVPADAPAAVDAWRLRACLEAGGAFAAPLDDLQPLVPAGYTAAEFDVVVSGFGTSVPLGLAEVTLLSCEDDGAGAPASVFLVGVQVEPPEGVTGLDVGSGLVLVGSVHSSPTLAQEFQRWGLGPAVHEELAVDLQQADALRSVGVAAGGLRFAVDSVRDDLGYASDHATRMFGLRDGLTIGALDVRPRDAGPLHIGQPSLEGDAMLGKRLPTMTAWTGSTVDRAAFDLVYESVGNLTGLPNDVPS